MFEIGDLSLTGLKAHKTWQAMAKSTPKQNLWLIHCYTGTEMGGSGSICGWDTKTSIWVSPVSGRWKKQLYVAHSFALHQSLLRPQDDFGLASVSHHKVGLGKQTPSQDTLGNTMHYLKLRCYRCLSRGFGLWGVFTVAVGLPTQVGSAESRNVA